MKPLAQKKPVIFFSTSLLIDTRGLQARTLTNISYLQFVIPDFTTTLPKKNTTANSKVIWNISPLTYLNAIINLCKQSFTILATKNIENVDDFANYTYVLLFQKSTYVLKIDNSKYVENNNRIIDH